VKTRILFAVSFVALLVAGLVVSGVATGKGLRAQSASVLPTSQCSPLQYGGSGSPQYIVASDLPLQGSSRNQTIEMTKAIAFTLKQAGYKAGKYTIGYQSCDDSTAQLGKWAPAKCSSNAGNYVRDKSVIGVIGTFNSGCAEIVVPVLNRVGMGMISPANTYDGLTHVAPGVTAPGEPNKYYPTGKRNYARIVAADDFQGSADVLLLKGLGIKSVYILNDKEAYGLGIANDMRNQSKNAGLKIAGFEAWDPKAASYQDIASKIQNSGAKAVFLGGLECENGGKLIKDLRAGLGKDVVLVAPDGFSSFKDTIAHAGDASEGMYISIAGQPYSKLGPGGKKFAAQFGKSIGLPAAKVNPYSNYGSTAMSMMLKAIAGSDGSRASVTANFYKTVFTDSPVGPFKINKNGDTNAAPISVYKVGGGQAKFFKVITPPAALVAKA
jgi:branched-chain amino acid transport system substrate-binding protein